MKIILKPGGLALIIVSFGVLVAAVFWLVRRQPETDTSPPVSSPSPEAAVPAVPPLKTGVNLLRNPDFEEGYAAASSGGRDVGKIGAGWRDDSARADMMIRYADETKAPQHGKHCQRIAVSQYRRGQVQMLQTLSVPAGTKLSFSTWIRSSVPVKIQIAFRDARQPSQFFSTGGANSTAAVWTNTRIMATIPRSTDVDVMVIIQGPSTVWVDDAVAQAVP